MERKGGGEKNSDGDKRRRRRREWGSNVHLTGGGGSSSGFVLLRCSHCCSAHSPPTLLLSSHVSPFFVPSLRPSRFSPAVVCQPQQHTLFRTHDLTESGEKGWGDNYSLALVYIWSFEGVVEWLILNIQTCIPDLTCKCCGYLPSPSVHSPCNSLLKPFLWSQPLWRNAIEPYSYASPLQ